MVFFSIECQLSLSSPPLPPPLRSFEYLPRCQMHDGTWSRRLGYHVAAALLLIDGLATGE